VKSIFARFVSLVASTILVALPASAQIPNALIHSIPAPPTGVQTGAQFGSSVAVDGGYTVVGAPYDDTDATDAGVVKVYDSTNGALLLTLTNPSPTAGDNFGSSVAISGTRVVVGAYRDDTGANNTGSAYVYNLSSVTPTVPVATLNNPGPEPEAQFGSAVAISAAKVVVGAPRAGEGASLKGRAFVYDLNSATPSVPMVTVNVPTTGSNQRFGNSVAILGTRMAVAAYFDDTGASHAGSVYVYEISSATPTVPVLTFNNPSPVADGNFGTSISISGSRMAVGTPGHYPGRVYVYDLDSGMPTLSGVPRAPLFVLSNPNSLAADIFGNSVSMSDTRVMVGAFLDDTGATDAGRAYAYDLSAGSPTVPVATLNNPGPAVGDAFGSSVAISGTRVVSGAPLDDAPGTDAGTAYLYELGSPTPTVPTATLNGPGAAHVAGDNFGNAVAVSGTLVVVGSSSADVGVSNAGIVQVYDLSSGTPTVPVITLPNPSPTTGDNFGYSVAVSGSRIVVGVWQDDTGASNAGSAYVYDLGGATPGVPVVTLNNPSATLGDNFGYSVSISGTLVLVGVPFDDTGASDAGTVYVYDVGSGTPNVPIHSLNNPSPGPFTGDNFGNAVSISGSRVAVGASFDDQGTFDDGSVHLYDLNSGTPTVPVATLLNLGTAANDLFGTSVAISGTRVVVGAIQDDTGASNSGSAYVFDLSSGTPTVPVATLNNPGPFTADNFGWSVGISGTRVVVGADGDDTGASAAGSAYVYDLLSGTPTVPVATLNNPTPTVGELFGRAVAIDGTTVAIGTPSEDTVASDEGAAYIYGPLYATTTAATGVTNIGATLNGTANPSGLTTTAQFQYGLTTAYGSTADVVLSPNNGTSPQAVSTTISGLLEGRAYHFRLTTTNNLGPSYGLDLIFMTLSGEIAVEQPVGSNLGDGEVLPSLGGAIIGTNAPPRVFTIKNHGTADLTGLVITKDGSHATDFLVNTTGMATTMIPGGSTTFTVTLSPGGTLTGTRTAAIHVASNDLDENPFDIPLTGQAFSITQDTDSDGLNDGAEFLYTPLGFDLQVSQTALVNTMFSNLGAAQINVNSAGYFNAAQVQALNIDTPLLQRSPTTGIFTLTIGVEKSTNLSIFDPFPMTDPQTTINPQGELEFHFNVPDDAAFFRLRAQ
jgi:hypothetical protein